MQRLQPLTFFNKWMAHVPLGDSARLFMTAARVDQEGWEDVHRERGIFFDRCRIVDYAVQHLPAEVWDRIRRWTAAAAQCGDLGDV